MIFAVAVLAAAQAWAQGDIKSLYDVSASLTGESLKAGERGAVRITFTTREGAHVSGEAPMKIELSSAAVKLDATHLGLGDSAVKGEADGKSPADPRFEVGFTAAEKGKGAVDAKLVFFICTEKLCSRQSKRVSLPVEVL